MIFTVNQLERYSRQFVLSQIGVEGQKRLLASKVLVIGAGALGSSAIMYLAAAGIGTIGIADGDVVELSNLQRQVIHGTKNVGMQKTFSAQMTVQSINPDVICEVYPYRLNADNIEKIIELYDFVLDCTDGYENKLLINDTCVLANKPYCHAGAVQFEGQVMTYVPDKGACLRCVIDKVPPPQQCVTCSQAGVLGAVTGVIGCVQATEAVKYLLDIGQLLTGKIFFYDALNMQTDIVDIPFNKKCRLCGEKADIVSVKENRNEYETDI